MGGRNQKGNLESSVETLDFRTSKWRNLPCLSVFVLSTGEQMNKLLGHLVLCKYQVNLLLQSFDP